MKESPDEFDPSNELKKQLLQKLLEVGERWKKEPPSSIERLFNKFKFLMAWLEAGPTIDVNTAKVPFVEEMYTLDDKQKISKVKTPGVKEALQVGVDQVEKHLDLLPEESRKMAEELLIRAKLYLAAAS